MLSVMRNKWNKSRNTSAMESRIEIRIALKKKNCMRGRKACCCWEKMHVSVLDTLDSISMLYVLEREWGVAVENISSSTRTRTSAQLAYLSADWWIENLVTTRKKKSQLETSTLLCSLGETRERRDLSDGVLNCKVKDSCRDF